MTLPNHIIDEMLIVRTDLNANITYVSSGFCKLTGYEYKSLLGKNASILGASNDFIQPVKNMWKSLINNGKWEGIFKNKKNDGTIYYQHSNINIDFDDKGNKIGYYVLITDITHTINNPTTIMFDRDFFKLFFSSDEDIIAVCLCASKYNQNAYASLIEISDKLAAMYGETKHQILSKKMSFADLLDPDSEFYKHQEKLLSYLDKNQNFTIVIKNINTTKKYYCKISVSKFHYQGQMAKIFKLADISNEIEAKKKLEELSIAKNKFLANFSHEIRTPLNATIGFVELMKEQTSDYTMTEYINIVLDNSKHLLDMMNDVIDFTSVDNDNIEINHRDFSPKDIQSTIEVFYAKSLEKEIDFTVYISPQLPENMVQDILRLKQIIANLLSNALKFTNYGGQIFIDVWNNDSELYISVKDTGIGMTTEQAQKVFDPFQQATKETELRYGGAGLGLSVVKKIVDKMNGEIHVDTKIGEGSTFKIHIPLIKYSEKSTTSKLDFGHVYLYVPSFSKEKKEILERYIRYFTKNEVYFISDLIEKTNDDELIILFIEDTNIETINRLSQTNKLIILKKFDKLVDIKNMNISNIQELNLPILGSKLYDAIYSLIHNKILLKSLNTKNLSMDYEFKGNILIAEDMTANIMLLENLLARFPKLKYTIVQDGEKALTEFKNSIVENKSKFDMILLDENMPIMIGSIVAARIRDIETLKNIDKTPLVALTANRYEENNTHLIDMDEYLPKPVDIKDLFSLLLKYIVTDNNITKNNKKGPNKIFVLKDIRDCFVSKNNNELKSILSKNIAEFSDSELLKLEELGKSKNKLEFNKLYNSFMKNIRKQNK